MTTTTTTDPTTKLANALRVITLDAGIRGWLEKNDPQAFEQALDALEDVEPAIRARVAEARENARFFEERLAPLTEAQAHALRTVSAEGGMVGVTSGRARPGFVQKALLGRLLCAGLVEQPAGGGFYPGQYRPGKHGAPIFITAAGAQKLRAWESQQAAKAQG